MESSDDEEVVLVRRRPTAAAPRMHSDGEEEDARATAPVDASLPQARDGEDDDTGVPLDAGAEDAPKPRLLRLKRRGDVEADGQADKEDEEADEEGGEQGDEEEALGEESEDEEAVLERRVAENGTLSDGDSSDGEGKDKGEAEEQGALDAAVLARLQALREARKDKEAQELEQQHILSESASRVKFKGGAGTRTDMNAVLDRIRARAGAVLPAAPPDESMIVDAGAGRGTHVVVPDDLGDLEALIIGGPQDAPGDVTADAGADELLVLPQTGGGEVDDDEEDGTGGMRLFGRAPPAGLQLRMDDTQGDGDELAAMEEEEDPMAGEAAEAAAAEDALVSETESDTDEDEEDADGDDVAPDADGDELPPPPQEALLTEEERLAQRAAVRAAAMQLLEEEKALRAAERSKAKAMAAAAAAGGGGEKLGFMEDEAEMSEDGGHTDDDDASDTDDDLAELEAMLAAAEEGGDAEAADAIRAKIHAEWEQAADDRAVAGVVRAMQTGWRRRRGRRLRGEDGDVDDDDPRGPRRRRRGEAGGDGDGDDDLDVRNPFLQSGDGVFDDDLMTQANLRGPPALGRGAPAPGSFMSLLAADDPSRAVLGLLRRRPMAPPLDKPTSGDAMDARGGGGSFFSRGGLPEGASLPQLPPRRGPDGGSSRAFVFARGDDSQGPRDAAGDAAHTDTPQVGVRGAKAAARAAAAAAATAKAGGGLRPAVSAGGTSLLGMLRSYSHSDSQATGDVGENLASNLRKAQGIRMD